MKKKTILVVDDEQAIRDMTAQALAREADFEVITAASGEEALGMITLRHPDLILLDVMLPGISGTELLRCIRAHSQTPVMLLTAKGEAEDKYEGFESGADDYLTKPFLMRELVLRVRALLRRAAPEEGRVVVLKNGSVDLDRAEARVRGADGTERVSQLTAREYEIFEKLSQNRGRIVSVNQLCAAIGGDSWVGYENTLMSHIRHLREKIEREPSSPENIITIRGLGYRLENA